MDKMRQTALRVLFGTFGLFGATLILWLAGLVFGIGGGLIHLLLLLAILIVPVGGIVGVVLLVIAGTRHRGQS